MLVAQALKSIGEQDTGIAENLAASAFCAQLILCGVVGIKGDAQSHGKSAFKIGRVEAYHMGVVFVSNGLFDATNEHGALENLLAQRLARRIAAVELSQ